jgi:hypothetical protein
LAHRFVNASQQTHQEKLPPVYDKYYGAIEGLLPAEGFVHGLQFPTKADLTVLTLTRGFMPYCAGMKVAGGYDWESKFPKMKRVSEAAAADPGVAAYLVQSTSMSSNPMGF